MCRPPQISETPPAGFEPVQNLSRGTVEESDTTLITATPVKVGLLTLIGNRHIKSIFLHALMNKFRRRLFYFYDFVKRDTYIFVKLKKRDVSSVVRSDHYHVSLAGLF